MSVGRRSCGRVINPGERPKTLVWAGSVALVLMCAIGVSEHASLTARQPGRDAPAPAVTVREGAVTATLIDKTTATNGTRPTTDVPVFFVHNGALAVVETAVPATSPRAGALGELFKGPSAPDRSAGLSTTVPAGTRIEHVTFVGTTANVDVDARFFGSATRAEFTRRLAQVVFTLTQFSGVDGVQLYLGGHALPRIDGLPTSRPLNRADVSSAVGDAVIVSPAIGVVLTSPVPFSGISEITGILELELVGPTGQLIIDTVQSTVKGETFTYRYPFAARVRGDAWLRVYAAPVHVGGPSVLVTSIPVKVAG